MSNSSNPSNNLPRSSSTIVNIMLDSYAICEEEMNNEIAAAQLARGQSVACAKGCFLCCTNQDIPILSPEALGVSWYISEVMAETERSALLTHLKNYKSGSACPLLIEGACSVHPVRPLACRKFLVYGRQCSVADGDSFYSRPEDIHPSITDRNWSIANRFLESPLYDLPTEASRLAAYKSGIMQTDTPNISSIEWIGFLKSTKDVIVSESSLRSPAED